MSPPPFPREIRIGRRLEGLLRMPRDAQGVVVFAHGSGSSRFSKRNDFVAGELGEHGMVTVLFDLLTAAESRDRRNVFDIDLLAERVLEAIDWVRGQPALERLPIGLFGASTGAAAALVAASERPASVAAVVSRGGRPDLAGGALASVRAPTLLIVGGADPTVLALNRLAAGRLTCEHRLEVVPGATHLFAEPGALEEVVAYAAVWFQQYLIPILTPE